MTIQPTPTIPSDPADTARPPDPPHATGNGWLVAALALAFAGLVAVIALLVSTTSGHGRNVFARAAAAAFVHAANRGDSAAVARTACASLARDLDRAPVRRRLRSVHAAETAGQLHVAIGIGTSWPTSLEATLYMRRSDNGWQFCEHPFAANR